MTKVIHFGFAGHEYAATKTFFEHYKLKAPSIPLLNPEFDNPLFLKLFCTTLVNLGQTEVPRGLPGLTTVFNGFLDSVNQKLSSPQILDFDRKDKLVHLAVKKLVQQMAASGTHWLPREDAKRIVNNLLPDRPDSTSLFRHLSNEGVIFENRAYSGGTGTSIEVIQFAFERFTDHLVAQAILTECGEASDLVSAFAEGGRLEPLITNKPAPMRKRGLLEALSVQVPEKYKRELMGVVPAVGELWSAAEAFLNSLVWRSTDAFTEQTLAITNRLLAGYTEFENGLFKRLLLLAATPAHPWNADFLHRNLERRNLTERDATWSIFVFTEFGDHGPVDRLIEWAWSEESKLHLDEDSVELAAIALTWFLTTSSRYARDQATKGLVSLLTGRLRTVASLVHRFKGVDDVYLLERLFAVAYGCAMRSSDKAALSILADATFTAVFASGRAIPHLLLRDYARGVIEFADQSGCELKFEVQRARPPYESEWVEPSFMEGELESWEKWWEGMPKEEWARVHIHHSVMGQEDFARYIIGTNSGSFEWTSQRRAQSKRRKKRRDWEYIDENRFDLSVVQRWIMRRVIDLGWTTELFGQFDRHLVEGRSDRTDHKAERIGKKYQWMAYHECLARVSDNFEFVGDSSARKNEAYDGPWQVGFIRDIDPSCLIKGTSTNSHGSAWWQPAKYDAWDLEPSDVEWVKGSEDLPDSRLSIEVSDSKGAQWLALQSYFSFDQDREDAEYSLPRRHVWYQIRTYVVRKRNLKKVFEWAKKQDFMNRWMPESHAAYNLFLGEYFWSPAYRYFQQPYYSRESTWSSQARHGFHKLPATVALTSDEYSHERGYDCSIEDTINLMLPSEVLFHGLQLRWNTRAGEYVDSKDVVTVQYPSAYTAGPPSVLVRQEALRQFLNANNLGIIWTVLGEKTVLTDRRDHWPGRLEISGAYTLQDQAVLGETHNKLVRPQS